MAFSKDRTDDGRRGAPDVQRVGDLTAEERAELVARRRFRRRLKALAAMGLALAAGTFLACSDAMRPSTRDAGDGDRDSGGDDAGDGELDAGMDGGRDAGPPVRDAAIDVGHHRDGMPVPDNLLE